MPHCRGSKAVSQSHLLHGAGLPMDAAQLQELEYTHSCFLPKEFQKPYHFWWRLSTQGNRSSREKPVHSDNWLVQGCAREENRYYHFMFCNQISLRDKDQGIMITMSFCLYSLSSELASRIALREKLKIYLDIILHHRQWQKSSDLFKHWTCIG